MKKSEATNEDQIANKETQKPEMNENFENTHKRKISKT